MAKSPQQELEEFLASLPASVQKSLMCEPMTALEVLESAQSDCKEFELRPRLERILWKLPAQWASYCQRATQQRKMMVEMFNLKPPKRPHGPPRKDELAHKAALLQRSGMNPHQIAAELNKGLGEDDKTTADAIRKLLKRHSQPDKT